MTHFETQPCTPCGLHFSGVTGGWGALTFFTKKFLLNYHRKRRQGRKGKWRGKWRGKFEMEEVEIWKRKGEKVWKWAEEFFFFFSFFFFLLSTLWNHWNLFGVYQNWKYLPGKIIFHARKNWENWLCPLSKIFLLRYCCIYTVTST